MGPFDVSSADIKSLDDDQLRKVLRLLLEAEVALYGVPLSSIRLGGDQNASDGGVDALVDWENEPARTDWLPRQLTTFQSKAEEMPASELKKEMAPRGILRPLFGELANNFGAYIVFSTNDCSEEMYQRRLVAMTNVVRELPNHEAILLDFYDASRIARWVNVHTSVANELREMIGRSLAGWRPFQNWSSPNLSSPGEYLVDDIPKVARLGSTDQQMQISDAIDTIRATLTNPGGIVRLVGVSGVGKTRLAEALFDETASPNALSSASVVYGDLSNSPTIGPTQIADRLVSAKPHCLLIVDNCPGNTHRHLAEIVQRPDSNVSLLTIDFDVGYDQHEGTRIFRLYSNGRDLIGQLLESRFPDLSFSDRHRIAEFADGNARVALAIARNADTGSGLADLSDRVLIDRLFLDGRRPTDDVLRRCAEVASLVYAFHVESDGDQKPEHPILAELAEVTHNQFYRSIAEFVERGTAQKRGTQRAILPHALAIRLATQALDRLPLDTVVSHFTNGGQSRLFRSFARRIGQLHESERAQCIARRLLASEELFDVPSNLDLYQTEILHYLAPANPEFALSAIERVTLDNSADELENLDIDCLANLAKTTRCLAYYPKFFERSCTVLLTLEDAELEDQLFGNVRSSFLKLFWIVGSGTQASPEQRLGFLDTLLANDNKRRREIGVQALKYALTTQSISPDYEHDFGSRVRGNEWRPASTSDQNDWFRGVVHRLIALTGDDNTTVATNAGRIFTQQIRELIRIGLIDEVETSIAQLSDVRVRAAAWKKLCEAMHYDAKRWNSEVLKRAKKLERTLHPKTIEERFVAIVTSSPWGFYPPGETAQSHDLASRMAEEVGQDVATQKHLWPDLLTEACAFGEAGSCAGFGCGLAKKVSDMTEAWLELLEVFSETPATKRNAAILCGFVEGAATRDRKLVETWLDGALTDEILGQYIVPLTLRLPLKKKGIDRLSASIDVGKAPIESYREIAAGGVTKVTSPTALADFLRKLTATGIDGGIVAANILQMYLFGHSKKKAVDSDVIRFGAELLATLDLTECEARIDDYELGEIAKACLCGGESQAYTKEVVKNLVSLANSNRSALLGMQDLLNVLGDLCPNLVLEIAFSDEMTAKRAGSRFFGRTDDDDPAGQRASINNQDLLILDWVLEDPSQRALWIARCVQYWETDDEGLFRWTPIAKGLIEIETVSEIVLEEFYHRFDIGSGTGPWWNRIMRRRILIEDLREHPNDRVRNWAAGKLISLDQRVERLIEEDRRIDERFE